MRIAHITSVHHRRDTRVVAKMCESLVSDGHRVVLFVADGFGREVVNGLEVWDVGRFASRWRRIMFVAFRIAKKLRDVDFDIYHIHDPELLPLANWLSFKGKLVIFDAHEDFPTQLLVKPYLSPFLRILLSRVMSFIEFLLVRRLAGVIAATKHIRDKFRSAGIMCIDVNNYPSLREFPIHTDWNLRKNRAVYVGGIERIRGICEMVSAIGLCSNMEFLDLCGGFNDSRLESEVKNLSGWSKVVFHGFTDRARVVRILSESMVGLVVLHPTANYKVALPVKMFEYMAAGIPVIASDFPLWRHILEEHCCGLMVDPMDSKQIASALELISSNPTLAREMGEAGRRAIITRFNWDSEFGKLSTFYSDALKATT